MVVIRITRMSRADRILFAAIFMIPTYNVVKYLTYNEKKSPILLSLTAKFTAEYPVAEIQSDAWRTAQPLCLSRANRAANLDLQRIRNDPRVARVAYEVERGIERYTAYDEKGCVIDLYEYTDEQREWRAALAELDTHYTAFERRPCYIQGMICAMQNAEWMKRKMASPTLQKIPYEIS